MAMKRKFKTALRKKKSARLIKRFKQAPVRSKVLVNKNTVSLGQGFPRKMIMTHKYEETVSITSTTGAPARYKFNCNGMYDPNYSGTGHKPMCFDQMAALYNHYTVIGSKIRCTVVNATSAGVLGEVALMYNDDTATSTADISSVAEQVRGKGRLIPAGSTVPFFLSNKYSAKKIFGGTVMSNTSLIGTATTNPTETSFWDIVYQAYGTGTNNVVVKVDISYIAIWSEPKDLGPS